MKILHIGKYYPPFRGGIEGFMTTLMKQQHADGQTVSAIVHHHVNNKPFIEEVRESSNIYRVPCYGQVAFAPISPLFGFYLNRAIKNDQPDILHIHMPNLSSFWCLLLSNARKIPWIIHWHADVLGSIPDYKIKQLYPLYRIFETMLLKKTHKIISTSNMYFQSSKPLQRFIDKVEVVPLGLADIKEQVQYPLETTDQLNLLMIGRLTYYKGHSLLVKSLSILHKQGININLNIIGGGELEREISFQIKELDLSEQIKLLGKFSDTDLQQELNSTDLLCLPSIERAEAFGVVLLEAMRAGKPCLVTDVEGSGMNWVVQDSVTGFVVKHNDVNSLVEKLAVIAANKSVLPELGANGRKRFEDVFSIKAVSKKISRVYEDIISE